MSQPWYVVQRTFRGYTRTTELSLWGRVFVPCVLLQGLLTTGLSVALALIATDCLVSIVLAMLTLTILFAAYFAVEAVRTENVFQLCAYIGASSAGTLGIVLSISQRDDAGQDLRTAFMSPSEEGQLIRWLMFGAASLQLLSFLLALLTCSGTGELRGFGMRTYKKVGTDPALIRRYRRYQQFCSGLKLDLLFQAGVISLCVLGFDKFSWQWRLSWSEGPPEWTAAPPLPAWGLLGLRPRLRTTPARRPKDEGFPLTPPRWLTLGMHVPLGFLWLPLGLGGVRRESVAALRLLLVLGAAQPIVLGVQLCTHVRPAGGQERLPGLRTAPHRPGWTIRRPRPLLRSPERRLSSGEASRDLRSAPPAAPK